MDFVIGAGVILIVWVFIAMRSKTKTIVAFNTLDWANSWFESNKIDRSSLIFSTYAGEGLVRNHGATAIAGTAKTIGGEDVGLVLEVVAGRGVVAAELLQPWGIGTWHKRASLEAQSLAKPLIDVMIGMAAERRKPTESPQGVKESNNDASLTPRELASPGGGQAMPSGQTRDRTFGPKITNATSVLTFKIGTRDAILLDYIEAPGFIQYKYILAVKNEAETPDLFVCCEWSHLSSSQGERQLFLGVFKDGAHANLGIDNQLSNRAIFLLRAVEVAKERLGMPGDMPLTDGEADVIKDMLRAINHGVNQELYANILSKYDGKIVEYMKPVPLSTPQPDKTGDTDDEIVTAEMDSETFGEELVDLVRRVAREEISFALRPGVFRNADQKEVTAEDAEIFGEDLLDMATRRTNQEWMGSGVELQSAEALSLVTDEDGELFGFEIVDVFRRAARDAIAPLCAPISQEPKNNNRQRL